MDAWWWWSLTATCDVINEASDGMQALSAPFLVLSADRFPLIPPRPPVTVRRVGRSGR